MEAVSKQLQSNTPLQPQSQQIRDHNPKQLQRDQHHSSDILQGQHEDNSNREKHILSDHYQTSRRVALAAVAQQQQQQQLHQQSGRQHQQRKQHQKQQQHQQQLSLLPLLPASVSSASDSKPRTILPMQRPQHSHPSLSSSMPLHVSGMSVPMMHTSQMQQAQHSLAPQIAQRSSPGQHEQHQQNQQQQQSQQQMLHHHQQQNQQQQISALIPPRPGGAQGNAFASSPNATTGTASGNARSRARNRAKAKPRGKAKNASAGSPGAADGHGGASAGEGPSNNSISNDNLSQNNNYDSNTSGKMLDASTNANAGHQKSIGSNGRTSAKHAKHASRNNSNIVGMAGTSDMNSTGHAVASNLNTAPNVAVNSNMATASSGVHLPPSSRRQQRNASSDNADPKGQGKINASSTHVTEFGVSVDGVEFRRREHLIPLKAQRLAAESLGPIETITFADITSCSRDQLRSYCSVYGLRRQNKPVMEMCLARAAACFHPNNPDFDLSKFTPSTTSAIQNRQQRKRTSSESENQLRSHSDSQSPSSPNASTIASPIAGMRQSVSMFHPQAIIAPSPVTGVPDSSQLGPGGSPYHMRTAATIQNNSQKRARMEEGDVAGQNSGPGPSSRFDPNAHNHAAHHVLFGHPDKIGDANAAAAAAQVDVGVDAAGSANFFGPGQLLAPPSGPYDAATRLATLPHTGHITLGGMPGHAGLQADSTSAPNVAHIAAITGMGGQGAAGIDGTAHVHGSGEFVSREQVIDMIRSSVEKVQMHTRDIVREEVTTLWQIVQDQRNYLERLQATIDNFSGHH